MTTLLTLPSKGSRARRAWPVLLAAVLVAVTALAAVRTAAPAATSLPVTVAGHHVYGIEVAQGVGYRIDNARSAPTGSAPEGIYLVTSSDDVDQWCCFDCGSGETSHNDDGNATMNAIEWGTACWFGGCVGSGPWVEADLENGLYHTNTGSNKDSNNSGVHHQFVSAWEKNNGTSTFTLKYGDATAGGLTMPYSGPLPNGYSPMKLQPSILLGTGGDNSTSGTNRVWTRTSTGALTVYSGGQQQWSLG